MKILTRSLFFLFIFFLSIGGLKAQYDKNTDTSLNLNLQNLNTKVPILSPSRLNFKLDLGFGYTGGSYSGFYTYIAPYLRYALTPKFKLDVGGMLSQGSYTYNYENTGNLNGTSTFLFARGNYLINDKFTLEGTIFKTFYPNPPIRSDLTSKYATDNFGYGLGLDYKINKHMSLGAHIIMSKGLNNNYLLLTQPSIFSSFPSNNDQPSILGW
jgi:hypothetical protein